MIDEFIRFAIVGAICFWLGIVLAAWFIGRNIK